VYSLLLALRSIGFGGCTYGGFPVVTPSLNPRVIETQSMFMRSHLELRESAGELFDASCKTANI